MAVGFNFYLILARLIDVDPHMTESRWLDILVYQTACHYTYVRPKA